MTRRSLFSSHLYGQIVVPLIAASVVLSLVASVAAVFFLQNLTAQWVTQVANATTSGVIARYWEFDDSLHSVAQALAANKSIQVAVARDDRARLASELSSAMTLTQSSVAVLDRAGVVLGSSGPGAPESGKPLAGVSAENMTVPAFTVVASDQAGNTRLIAVEPIGTSAQGPRVAVIRPIDDELIGELAESSNGGFCFFSTSGSEVACAVTGVLPEKSGIALKQTLEGSDPTIREALEKAASSSSGQATIVVAGSKYRVVARRVNSPKSVARFDGYMVGSVSQAVPDQVGKTMMNLIYVWFIVAILGLLALGFWVARRVSAPLSELADGVRRIADGDFTARVNFRGENEIAVLGRTFNDMTASLRDRSESLTKKVLELATLYEMSRALGSTLDMDDLLGSTLDSALRIFDLDVGYVALRERDSGVLEIRAIRGDDAAASPPKDPVSSSMAEWVVREGRPLIFNPDPNTAEGQVDVLTGAKAALCVPLVSPEGTIGAITVGSRDATYRFDSDDVRLLSTIGNHVTIAVGNIELFLSLQEAYLATVRSLAAAVDAKDTYTRGHSDKVASYAIMIAQRMHLSHEQLTALEMAAYLHDIGKIGVSEKILLKPGRLSEDEMTQMRHHPLIGANILKPVAFPWAITPIVRHHHEYWDGGGYPAGLKGEEIPLLARVLCVADSYEAMTADRPYRRGRSATDAIAELKRCSGTQFDPRIVESMTDVIEELERTGTGVLGEVTEDVQAEEARAIFAALVDGVLGSFRRLGGPRLASNVESEVDAYFVGEKMPFRMVNGRLTFSVDSPDDVASELEAMRLALHYVDATIARVSGGTLVEHFYDDALDGFSARMRQLAVTLQFRED